MNKLAAVLLGMGLSISGLTQAAGVGFVDLAKVVDSSSYLKQQNASLNQSVKPTTTKLEQLGKELDALRQKAETEGRNMKEADVQKLNQQYQTKLSEFNSTQQGLQTRVQGTLQTMNNTFETRVKQAGEQLRQENNLDFILNKNAAVAYDAKNDLTDKMIQKVNAIK
ncbi:MAG TPA: OmpH family outer membrane protein [Acinetobacter ursingii]|uniref:OmpH family outer membrane protein n=1 Tax=Acinetobacter ursingii TaxID=108980 RepID=A0A3D2SLX6_9GAMM|nr:MULTISPECIES: OmpH family outer membrane protein [Acinetobacter]MCH2005052.1 OmpH family outer membrane protein [Acinetobacter ursingii]MCU4304511.1 OmpH family outer membrane protein [Acinetobacter ursingii]MCU4370516.1 OmpH family outer membrane protein [Acinetobacter ursingii]MCU4380235.1 OmpH family outer membrane protein [Acinetobacter ursingii]MCU4609593.1 OmpH family outer membrane protein [Acinetobacter ursingii]